MSRDRALRAALWASVVLNALGVVAFAPLALGLDSPLLPLSAPRYFAAQMAFTIALFGAVYAWLAIQPRVPKPLVVVGGVGKLGFFCLTLTYVVIGEIPAAMAVSATPDLVLGAVFLVWAATGD